MAKQNRTVYNISKTNGTKFSMMIFKADKYLKPNSASLFEAPIIFVGLTALSVEIKQKNETFALINFHKIKSI